MQKGRHGITLQELALHKGLPLDHLLSLGWQDSCWPPASRRPIPAVLIPYRDAHGNTVARRYRIALDGDDRFRWHPGDRVHIYGLDRLDEVRRRGWVLLVEGETDLATCLLPGVDVPCLAIPGATAWQKAFAQHLAHIPRIYVWREPGTSGERFVSNIASSLPQVLVVEAPPFAKDVNELYLHLGGRPDRLAAQLHGLIRSWAHPLRHPWAGIAPTARVGRKTYAIHGGRLALVRKRPGRDPELVPLGEFAALVRRQLLIDHGDMTEVELEMEGYTAEGAPLGETGACQVRAADLEKGLAWLDGWSVAARPDRTRARDIGAAILALSRPTVVRVYAHTGWVISDGRHLFVHGGGAIHAGGCEPAVERRLEGLERMALPPPPQGEDERLSHLSLLQLLEAAPPRVSAPLLLGALAAPARGLDASLALVGETGAYKTGLAMVVQSLFGWPIYESPPLSWESTGNAAESLSWTAADILLLIDDLQPEHTAVAERLVRAAANRAGRSRARPDGSFREARYPRGVLLITAEDAAARRLSAQARLITLPVQRGDISSGALSALQAAAGEGRLAAAMAAWIRWLAGQMPELPGRLRRRAAAIRASLRSTHPRLADNFARLQAVWELYASYLRERDILAQEDLAVLGEQVLAGLHASFIVQEEEIRERDPVRRFPLLLQALFLGWGHLRPARAPQDPLPDGRYGWERHLQLGEDRTYTRWVPRGRPVGWAPPDPDRQGIYLDPVAAYVVLARIAAATGLSLPSEQAFWGALARAGLIAVSRERSGGREALRYRVKQRIGGRPTWVVHVLPHVLAGEAPSAAPEADHEADEAAGDK